MQIAEARVIREFPHVPKVALPQAFQIFWTKKKGWTLDDSFWNSQDLVMAFLEVE